MTWQDGFVDTNGIRLHYHRTGGNKPQVVLSHGFSDNGLCWTRTARALEADYDLIMPDARGHGLSSQPAEDYHTETHAADLASLIEALKLDKPVVMGHSMGAGIASTLAANYPHLTRAIVLEDPPWRPETVESDAERQKRATDWRKNIVRRQQLPLAEIIREGKKDNPAWDDVEFEPWAQAKQQMAPQAAGLVRGLRGWQAVVPQITCPTLLITAEPERGGIVSAEIAAQVMAEQPRITHVFIPAAGHNIRREQFEPFIDAVRAFLAEHAA